jgi:hypothetical protein
MIPTGARLIRLCAVATALAFGVLITAVRAAPIQYTLAVDGGNTSGTIGGVAFTQGVETLQFTGDTKDVLPYTVPNISTTGTTSGYILLKGTATITIYDLANGNSYQATFLPAAGIFVSIDNTHVSVGFGSFGVPPGSPGFPGLVAYPEGMLGQGTVATDPFGTWDLRSSLGWQPGWTISDAGFPLGPDVKVGPALATTAGALIFNQQFIASSSFEAPR